MFRKDIKNLTKSMRVILHGIDKMATQYDSEAIEELAKELESMVGSLVAEMQINGIMVATQIGHNGGDSPIFDN